jgi:hypothetical protein
MYRNYAGTPLSLNLTKLKLDLNPDYFNVNASNQLSPVFELKGLNTTNNPIKLNTTTKLLEFGYSTNHFSIDGSNNLKFKYTTYGGIMEHSSGILIKLADTSLSLSTSGIKLNADAIYFDIGASGLQPKFLCTGIDAGTPLSLNLTKLKLDLNPDYFNVNASNQLSPVFEFKGLKTTSNPLKIDTTTKLLEFLYNPPHFVLDGTSRLSLRFKSDGGLVQNAVGTEIKLADTSLSLSTLGLQVSSTYKTELQQIKTDTETFKTQAQTAKTGADTAKTGADTAKTAAEAARTAAETAKTQATTQATTATSQATIATTQATTATTQAGIATTQATAATAAATSATAAAASATASSGAAAGAATAAAAAAAAAAVSATFFQKGDKGDTGPQGPAGDPRLTENPFYIQDNTIKLKTDDTLSISDLTGNLEVVGSNITGLNWDNITLNRPSIDLSSYLTQSTAYYTFPTFFDLYNYYTKTETDTLLTNKQNALTFFSPLVNTNNNITLSTTNLITTSGGQTISGSLTVSQAFTTYDNIYEGNNYLYNKYEAKLTPSTTLLGDGSAITNIDFNNIVNVPSSSASLNFLSPLSKNVNNEVNIDLSSYLTNSVASTTYATFSNLDTKEDILTFDGPLTRTSNIIGINLSLYLTTSVALSTFPTFIDLGAKEAKLTFDSPLTRTANSVGINLSSYLTTATASSTYLTQTNATNTYATISALNNKENVLTFNSPFIRTGNTIDLNLGSVSGSYLPLTGGTLTGALIGTTINATTFNEGGSNLSSKYLGLAGGTLTGALTGTTINATTFNEGGSNLSSKYLGLAGGTLTGALTGTTINATTFNEGGTALTSKYLRLIGGTLTGALTGTTINATTFNEGGVSLASKYLQSTALTNYLLKTGDTMTGSLTISGSTSNKLIFDNVIGNTKIQLSPNNGIGVDTTGVIISSSGAIRFANGLNISNILASISSTGNLSLTGSISSGSISTTGSITASNLSLGTSDIQSVRNITTSGNITINSSKLNFNNVLNDYKINLWDNLYGFGIRDATLAYFCQGSHNFYNSSTPTNPVVSIDVSNPYVKVINSVSDRLLRISATTIETLNANETANRLLVLGNAGGIVMGGFTGYGITTPRHAIDIYNASILVRGSSEASQAILYICNPYDLTSALKTAIIAQGISSYSRSKLHFCNNNEANNTSSATVSNARMTIDTNGYIGVNNTSPIGMLTVGNAAIANNDGHIIVGKQDGGGGTRQFRIGYTPGFSAVIGDCGNNNVVATQVNQFRIIYTAPVDTLVCYGDGNVGTKFGNVVQTSDERLKTDISTIDNALDKVLHLRGVNFTYIQEGTKSIGLIAQEVEHIIPEVVFENDGIKSISYANMVGLLVEAMKQQQSQIAEMKEQINYLLNK